MEKQPPTINLNVRFPPDVIEAMRRLARQDARSLNSEVIWALRNYIARRQEQEKGDARA
jgi:hypothetical protein